jgi:hypothetical protein
MVPLGRASQTDVDCAERAAGNHQHVHCRQQPESEGVLMALNLRCAHSQPALPHAVDYEPSGKCRANWRVRYGGYLAYDPTGWLGWLGRTKSSTLPRCSRPDEGQRVLGMDERLARRGRIAKIGNHSHRRTRTCVRDHLNGNARRHNHIILPCQRQSPNIPCRSGHYAHGR